MPAKLADHEVAEISAHCMKSPMTLAIIRTEEAPTELASLFESIASACSLSFRRNMWAPASDFGFAELYSNGRIVVVLYIGGTNTELVSVSETDEIHLKELEDSISASNVHSSTIRDGL